jgi:hypothetical protein
MITTYPPDSSTIATSIGDVWRQFRPEYNAHDTRSGFIASAMSRVIGGEYHEDEEVLVCRVLVEKLYDMNYTLQRLCHFNKEVFMKVGQDLVGQNFDRGQFIFFSCL